MFQSKIDTILSAIREEAARRQHAIEQQTEQKMQEALARAEAEVLQETYDMIKRRSSAIRESAGRQISEQEQSARRSLFERRSQIMREVFEQAKERLRAFAASDDYAAFLEKSVHRIAEQAGNTSVTLFVRPEDLERAKGYHALFEAALEVQADFSIVLGGLRGRLEERQLCLDDTLDARLDAQQTWFMAHSGLTIGEASPAE